MLERGFCKRIKLTRDPGGTSGPVKREDSESQMSSSFVVRFVQEDYAISITRPAHPRFYGSFARFLGRYVRDMQIMTLEEAVRKITHNAANILGIKDRGLIMEGMCADITVFDPNIVDAVGDYAEPRRYAKGIPYVIVNGKLAVDMGKHTGVLAGRFLKHEA